MSFVKSKCYADHKDHTVMVINHNRANATIRTAYQFICVTCGRKINMAPQYAAKRYKAMNKPAGVLMSDLFTNFENKHEN